MAQFKVTLIGLAPLIMHNERLANPRDPITRELKRLTAQRGKTDETLDEIMRVEWRGGLYDDGKRVCMPAANVIACFRDGAKQAKLGKKANAAIFAIEPLFPLSYEGPKKIEDLYEDNRFVDYRSVGVNGSRVMRTRPIFRAWSVDVALEFDPEILAPEQLMQAAEKAGSMIGLCDHRPQYGRFSVAA